MRRSVTAVAALAALCFYAEGKNPDPDTSSSLHDFVAEEIDSGAVSGTVLSSPQSGSAPDDEASEDETYDLGVLGASALRDPDADVTGSPQNNSNEAGLLHCLLQSDQKDNQECSLELSFEALEEPESSEQQSKGEISASMSDTEEPSASASVQSANVSI